jgi:hypothetical protein
VDCRLPAAGPVADEEEVGEVGWAAVRTHQNREASLLTAQRTYVLMQEERRHNVSGPVL